MTLEWVRKAEDDYQAALELGRSSKPFADQICFHCQQSAEKYCKALLEELNLVVPRTHDLEDLLALLLPHYAELRSLRRGLVFLTKFAVPFRYPGAYASKRQATASARWAARVREAARQILGIKDRKKRRGKGP